MSSYLSVLVVEDNEGDFVLVEDFLIECYQKIQIEHCADLKTTKQCLNRTNREYSVILLDLNLPDLSGIDLIQEVIQHSYDIPVIVLTGYADLSLAKKSLKLGVYDFLIKDEINPSLLQKSIDFSLSRKYFISQIEKEKYNYKMLFNFSPESIWVYDLKTYKILDVNSIAIDRFNYTLDELRSMHIYDLFPPDFKHEFIQKLESASDVNHHSSYGGIFKLKRKTGEFITVEVYFAELKYQSVNCRMLLSIDITEKKRLQEELQVISYRVEKRERERVAISLHNGLQQILLAAYMHINKHKAKLKTSLDDSSYNTYDKGINMLLEGIEKTRKISHEMMPVEIEETGLSAGIETILNRYSSSKLNFHFEEQYDLESLPANLKISLFIIIQEAINNIVKHSEASEVIIQLKEKKKIIFMNIIDNGKGFDTVHVKQNRLGLNAIKTTANSVDGNLEIESTPGKGTVLKVSVPII